MNPVERDFRNAVDMGFYSNCAAISACALFTYDRILTIEQEVAIGSRRRISVASALCWLMQLAVFIYLWMYMSMIMTASCERGYMLDVTLNIAAATFHACVGAISAMRAYGINGQSIKIPAFIMCLSLVASGIDVYKSFTLLTMPLPLPVGCALLWASYSNAIQNLVWVCGQICGTVAEVLVLAATWHTAYGMKRMAYHQDMPLSISTILLRDGTVYFSLIIIVLILNGVLNHAKSNSFTTPITYALQSTLISRFFLNLRQAVLMPGMVASSPSQISGIQFSRVLGNLGGSLALSTDEDSGRVGDNLDEDEKNGVEMHEIREDSCLP